jgi:hypothetical protein
LIALLLALPGIAISSVFLWLRPWPWLARSGVILAVLVVWWHLASMLLHACASFAVLGVALQAGLASAPALGAALLFAVHPVHDEAVAWISGCFDLLAGTLVLTALWTFGHARRHRSRRQYALAVALGTLAPFAKETAIVLPTL